MICKGISADPNIRIKNLLSFSLKNNRNLQKQVSSKVKALTAHAWKKRVLFLPEKEPGKCTIDNVH